MTQEQEKNLPQKSHNPADDDFIEVECETVPNDLEDNGNIFFFTIHPDQNLIAELELMEDTYRIGRFITYTIPVTAASFYCLDTYTNQPLAREKKIKEAQDKINASDSFHHSNTDGIEITQIMADESTMMTTSVGDEKTRLLEELEKAQAYKADALDYGIDITIGVLSTIPLALTVRKLVQDWMLNIPEMMRKKNRAAQDSRNDNQHDTAFKNEGLML